MTGPLEIESLNAKQTADSLIEQQSKQWADQTDLGTSHLATLRVAVNSWEINPKALMS